MRSMSVVSRGFMMVAVCSATIRESSASERSSSSSKASRSADCFRISWQKLSCPEKGSKKWGNLRAPVAQTGVES